MAGLLSDLTIIYITANHISDFFAANTRRVLVDAALGLPIISVSHKPMNFGKNICFGDNGRSQANIYRQVLIGAREAKTKYVAIAEDDVLYHENHFKFRPKDGHWGYNMNAWSIFTWGEPMLTYKTPGGRKNLNGLICERKMLIDHLEERFKLHPDDDKIDIRIFGEPGKYDNLLGTTPHPVENFYTNPPNIVFSHQTNLPFEGLGTRKRAGDVRATAVPYWGRAEDLRKLYE